MSLDQARTLEALQQRCNAFFNNIDDSIAKEQISLLAKLLYASNYAWLQFQKNPQLFQRIIEQGKLANKRNRKQYLSFAATITDDNEKIFMRSLRLFRHQELIRIAWRAQDVKNSVRVILKELSDLADICILTALEFAYKQINKKHNPPILADGQQQKLYVMALGKLGGEELNFSSDVDINFAYPYETMPTTETELAASQYFTKVAKYAVRMLSEVTADGFVYRVDLRLRPYGQSGPIAMSFKAIDNYYQEQGRDWERYAMVKARVINPDQTSGKLMATLSSFVYRRYIDFSVLEALRSLKAIIQREVRVQSLQDDIKRGPGGIREIEFICQSQQLIRGGRALTLRTTNIYDAYQALSAAHLFDADNIKQLIACYDFYRQLENAIQMLEDKQQHQLPADLFKRQQLLTTLSLNDWHQLEQKLKIYRDKVSHIFNSMLEVKALNYQDEDKVIDTQLVNLCRGKLADIPSEDLLRSLGFVQPQTALQQLNGLLASHRYRHLSQIGKLRLEQFLPLLLKELQSLPKVDAVFFQVLKLLESILKRSTYLALLTENPIALKHLLALFSLSGWVAEKVSAHPFLLEVLLDEQTLYNPMTEKELENQLSAVVGDSQDLEFIIEQLNRFKLTQQLKVAAGALTNQILPHQVTKHLSRTANVILKTVLNSAKKTLQVRHNKHEPSLEKFAIIAYGKLGSEELHLTSDLDLVFLHSIEQAEDETAIVRLSRKILSILNTRTLDGVLYQVDTRLRPSGSAGLLVSHIDAFELYQQQKAWTWEHQALVKARFLAGDQTIAKRFEQLRTQVLMTNRDKSQLAAEVVNMRLKMKAEFKGNRSSSLKQRDYGLIDIEFLCQYLVLALAHDTPELINQRSVFKILQVCYQKQHIAKQTFLAVINYYDALQRQVCFDEWLSLLDDDLATLTIPKSLKQLLKTHNVG